MDVYNQFAKFFIQLFFFFVYTKHCKENCNEITFNINSVQQLNPTIAGKMFFKNLEHKNVKKYYFDT